MKYNPGLEELNRIWDDGKEGKAAIVFLAAVSVAALVGVVLLVVL